ncbi:MAG: flagellar motor switch protein FliM [Candidatus Zixiibacteriota bacterium]
MAKLLEQNEIDQLFGNDGGEKLQEQSVENNNVKVYDFRHPDRLSKDQTRLLHSLMENFCRFTATFISATTRSLTEMTISSIDQLTYNEYMFSMNEPVALYIVRFKELGGRALFEISTRFVLFLVDRMLGGSGALQTEERDLTAIEERVSLNVMEKIFTNFSSVWKEVFSFNAVYESFESNPRLVQIAPPGESVILISIDINSDGDSTLLNICIPFIVLQKPLRNLASRNWNIEFSDDQNDIRNVRNIHRLVKKVRTDARCILGKKKTTLRELASLKEGDTIRLDQRNDRPLVFEIGGRKKFHVEPGVLGERKALKIIDKIQ